MGTARLALASITCGLAVAACSGNDAADPLADARAFCQELAPAWAGRLTECTPVDGDSAALPSAFELSCASVAKAAAEGTISYDRAAAQACLDALAAEPCAVLRASAALPAACKEATAPTVPPGGDCWAGRLDLECRGGYCRIDPLLCQYAGTCEAWLGPGAACNAGGRCLPGYYCDGLACQAEAVVQEVGEGVVCALFGVVCAPGLFCDYSTPVQVCTAPRASGACGSSSECAAGLDCRCTEERCATRQCLPELRLGAACIRGREECVQGLWCGASGTCERGVAVGGECGFLGGERVGCRDGWCDAPLLLQAAAAALPITVQGTCRAFLPRGADCGALASFLATEACGPGATCADGRCAVSYCGRSFVKR